MGNSFLPGALITQVDVGKTSLLELNSVNMSHSSTKETIINELEECFLLLLKDP